MGIFQLGGNPIDLGESPKGTVRGEAGNLELSQEMLDALGILSPTYIGNVPGYDHPVIIAGEPTTHQFGVGESTPSALCYDGTFLYMAGMDTRALYIVDTTTGIATFVGHFRYNPLPPGVQIRTDVPYTDEWDKDIYLDTHRNLISTIQITGIAWDGKKMYAVDSFTNALYIVE